MPARARRMVCKNLVTAIIFPSDWKQSINFQVTFPHSQQRTQARTTQAVGKRKRTFCNACASGARKPRATRGCPAAKYSAKFSARRRRASWDADRQRMVLLASAEPVVRVRACMCVWSFAASDVDVTLPVALAIAIIARLRRPWPDLYGDRLMLLLRLPLPQAIFHYYISPVGGWWSEGEAMMVALGWRFSLSSVLAQGYWLWKQGVVVGVCRLKARQP